MRKYNQKNVCNDGSRLFYFAITSFIVIFCAYVYFVSVSVAHVVMRKELDTNISALATTISQLESRYIEVQHLVSNDIATYNGYVVANKKIFIHKTAETLVLSGN